MDEGTVNEKSEKSPHIDATFNLSTNNSAAEATQPKNSPIRGAIKTIITTSTDNIVSGEYFSIFVTIQNPFERELKIYGVSTNFPVEFKDLAPQKPNSSDTAHPQNLIPESTSSSLLPGIISNIFGGFKVSIGLGPLDVELSPSVARPMDVLHEKDKGDGGYTPLQPGNSTVRTFTIKTRKNILFTPSTYRFNILIDYMLDDERNLDTIQHIINIRSSLFSILVGATIGGFGGWLINRRDMLFLDNSSLSGNLISLLVSLLTAILAVVLLARKKDIQPLITVEDIWGGIAIGFIAAYSGPKYLESLVQPAGNTTVQSS